MVKQAAWRQRACCGDAVKMVHMLGHFKELLCIIENISSAVCQVHFSSTCAQGDTPTFSQSKSKPQVTLTPRSNSSSGHTKPQGAPNPRSHLEADGTLATTASLCHLVICTTGVPGQSHQGGALLADATRDGGVGDQGHDVGAQRLPVDGSGGVGASGLHLYGWQGERGGWISGEEIREPSLPLPIQGQSGRRLRSWCGCTEPPSQWQWRGWREPAAPVWLAGGEGRLDQRCRDGGGGGLVSPMPSAAEESETREI